MNDNWDILYAGAGIVWGAVVLYRGVQVWREDANLDDAHCSVRAMPLGRTALPIELLGAAILSLACSGYLFWRLWS